MRTLLAAIWMLVLTLGGAGVCGLAGCSAEGPPVDLMVEVRDAATHRPIEGALVAIQPMDPRHPLRTADLLRAVLGGDNGPGVKGRTDRQGRVGLSPPTDVPVNVLVGAVGFQLDTFYFDDAALLGLRPAWRTANPVEDSLTGAPVPGTTPAGSGQDRGESASTAAVGVVEIRFTRPGAATAGKAPSAAEREE